MTVSASRVHFDEHTMTVDLTDGRTVRVPLAWFPRLLRAKPAQRAKVELSHVGLHWEELDEDISIAGLLAGHGDITKRTEADPVTKPPFMRSSWERRDRLGQNYKDWTAVIETRPAKFVANREARALARSAKPTAPILLQVGEAI